MDLSVEDIQGLLENDQPYIPHTFTTKYYLLESDLFAHLLNAGAGLHLVRFIPASITD